MIKHHHDDKIPAFLLRFSHSGRKFISGRRHPEVVLLAVTTADGPTHGGPKMTGPFSRSPKRILCHGEACRCSRRRWIGCA